uniref:Putative secreted protein n=1 Tax=Rhipicephalus microplus TaxID=6941 RepID=A0A6G5A1Y2_RHIMP
MCSPKLSFFLLLFVILLHCNENLILFALCQVLMLLRNQTVPEILQPLALNCSATRLPTPLNLPPIDSQCSFTDASKVRHYH